MGSGIYRRPISRQNLPTREEAMMRLLRALNFAAIVLGIVGSVITVVVAFQQWLPKFDPTAKLAVTFLGISSLILMIATVWQEYRYARKARYAEVLQYLSQISAETLKPEPVSSVNRIEEIEAICRLIVNRLSGAFSLVTGTKCSVCIKAVMAAQSAPALAAAVTLCRDDTSIERETAVSATEAGFPELAGDYNVEHLITGNTAFSQALKYPWSPRSRCFFSNYLPSETSYQNTSFQIHGPAPTSRWPFVRNFKWPLPYKSTIVCPIGRGQNLQLKYEVVGFLAVDSRSRRVFSNAFDIDVMIGVADSLFNLVNRYRELVKDKLDKEASEYGT
jgi:hypothetical protein